MTIPVGGKGPQFCAIAPEDAETASTKTVALNALEPTRTNITNPLSNIASTIAGILVFVGSAAKPPSSRILVNSIIAPKILDYFASCGIFATRPLRARPEHRIARDLHFIFPKSLIYLRFPASSGRGPTACARSRRYSRMATAACVITPLVDKIRHCGRPKCQKKAALGLWRRGNGRFAARAKEVPANDYRARSAPPHLAANPPAAPVKIADLERSRISPSRGFINCETCIKSVYSYLIELVMEFFLGIYGIGSFGP
jgi:hypothetical protein